MLLVAKGVYLAMSEALDEDRNEEITHSSMDAA